MESLLLVGSLTDIAMLVGLAVTRVSVAFLLIPIFTSEMVPTLVRNTIFVALAVLVVVVQPTVDVKAMSSQAFLHHHWVFLWRNLMGARRRGAYY
jgi:type III secretion protein T